MIYLIIFIFVNVLIGLIIIMLSGVKYPYNPKTNSSKDEFTDYEDMPIEQFEENEELENEKINLPKNDEDKVNQLAQRLIPSDSDFHNPELEAAQEMEEKVKGYFDNNPNEAAKIFKTMLKKDK